jgi:hypothetical protein
MLCGYITLTPSHTNGQHAYDGACQGRSDHAERHQRGVELLRVAARATGKQSSCHRLIALALPENQQTMEWLIGEIYRRTRVMGAFRMASALMPDAVQLRHVASTRWHQTLSRDHNLLQSWLNRE